MIAMWLPEDGKGENDDERDENEGKVEAALRLWHEPAEEEDGHDDHAHVADACHPSKAVHVPVVVGLCIGKMKECRGGSGEGEECGVGSGQGKECRGGSG